MGAFNPEYETMLLERIGDTVSLERKVTYFTKQVKAVIAERNGSTNDFTVEAERVRTIADGFSEYGDLTYKRSEEFATTDQIQTRYALENLGWEAVRSNFFNLPLYSTVLLFSPPAKVKIDGYAKKSMAYFYHILPHVEGDPEKRTIKALALMHNLDEKEQATILNGLYRTTIGPVDSTEESVLLHPGWIQGNEDKTISFRSLWEKVKETRDNEKKDFFMPDIDDAEMQLLRGEKVWRDRFEDLSLMTREIAIAIAQGVTADELKRKWRIMINFADQEMADSEKKRINDRDGEELVTTVINSRGELIFDRYDHLNKEIQMRATPCGPSGEVTFTRDSSLMSWSFDAIKPGSEKIAGEKTLSCTCPFCKEKVDAIIRNNRIICPNNSCGKSAPYTCP